MRKIFTLLLIGATLALCALVACKDASSGPKNTGYKITVEQPPEEMGYFTVRVAKGTPTQVNTRAAVDDRITLTAVPEAGLVLEKFTVVDAKGKTYRLNGTDKLSRTFTMPAANVTVSAEFVEPDIFHKVLISVAAYGDIALESGGDEARPGSMVTILATPVDGYRLHELTVTGNTSHDSIDVFINGNTAVFEMPDEAVTVVPEFISTVYPEYAINITQPANSETVGTIAASRTKGMVADTVTIIASPKDPYLLSRVTVIVTVSGAEIPVEYPATNRATFKMPSFAVNVSAHFFDGSAPQYDITVIEPDNGSISISGNLVKAPQGENILVTANPSVITRYKLTEIIVTKDNDDAVDVELDGNIGTFKMPAAAVKVSASFEELPKHAVATAGGAAAAPSSQYAGEKIDITLTFNNGTHKVADPSIIITDASNATLQVFSGTGPWQYTMPAEAVTVTGHTIARVFYTVSNFTGADGNVTSNKASAEEGDTVELTILPIEHKVLNTITVTWSSPTSAGGTVTFTGADEGVTHGSKRTFAMPAGNVTIAATFKDAPATPIMIADFEGLNVPLSYSIGGQFNNGAEIQVAAVTGIEAPNRNNLALRIGGYHNVGAQGKMGAVYPSPNLQGTPINVTMLLGHTQLEFLWRRSTGDSGIAESGHIMLKDSDNRYWGGDFDMASVLGTQTVVLDLEEFVEITGVGITDTATSTHWTRSGNVTITGLAITVNMPLYSGGGAPPCFISFDDIKLK